MDYTPTQIRHTIERYQELRSIAEVVASCLEDGESHVMSKCRVFENILCMLVDLDTAILLLTPRQQEVVRIMKAGYTQENISHQLNISIATIKFHRNAAILNMTAYLNFGKM